jgi:ribosomal protein S18 acetylase RimI-like enzyme
VRPPGRWQELLADPEQIFLMAEDDGELLGYTACGTSRDADMPPEAGEVRTMFVSPSAWRRGVGGALMAAALDELRRRGFAGASLWSFADNDRANAFYEANGFTRDGAEKREEHWAHLLEVRYRRSL